MEASDIAMLGLLGFLAYQTVSSENDEFMVFGSGNSANMGGGLATSKKSQYVASTGEPIEAKPRIQYNIQIEAPKIQIPQPEKEIASVKSVQSQKYEPKKKEIKPAKTTRSTSHKKVSVYRKPENLVQSVLQQTSQIPYRKPETKKKEEKPKISIYQKPESLVQNVIYHDAKIPSFAKPISNSLLWNPFI